MIDAKAIYDSMFGASGFLAMDEKWEIQEGMQRQKAFPRWCEANLSDELQGNGKDSAGKTGVHGVYMTKQWSVPENVDNKVNQPPAEETTCPQIDLDKRWVEDWLADAIHQNEPNLDESENERAFVDESLSELRDTMQRLF